MDSTDIIFSAAVGAILVLLLTVIGGSIASDYMIAHSPDPLITACAFGRKEICIIVAGRKQ